MENLQTAAASGAALDLTLTCHHLVGLSLEKRQLGKDDMQRRIAGGKRQKSSEKSPDRAGYPGITTKTAESSR
ncbi:hypothetical protein QN219_10840 [Sinorhizobium sp. 7-81]|uniref:hypothetical protein n=1 Tax=Sinorhizobium sp. 8-89 TaxID=3049089 RepID=UPI0024C277B2|nr:hypothetical protein [Sinorhizobium sp. 8-89]MDK1490555.1 hypothetical protein [Sinorhizobium sp. 8-89]